MKPLPAAVGAAAPAIESAIAAATGAPFRIDSALPSSGGCIHRSYVIGGPAGRCFLKLNDVRHAPVLDAEADGLAALAAAGIRVPHAVAAGIAADASFLVLEFLPLAAGTDEAYRALGRAIANLHARPAHGFGWPRRNFIGLTPQTNGAHASWAEFWRHERLAPQLELAARNGFRDALARGGARVLDAVPALLAGHSPRPALLHGDLWHGNAGFLTDGTPVVFDPAVYCGDPETDLAMTELFGGFPAAFYAGVREIAPADGGYPVRRTLYNLYHVLNHLNLFGAGYLGQAQRMMAALIAAAA